MKLQTLIVDDEPLAREKLELLVKTDPELECVGLRGDGDSAVEAIRALRPDIVFLDIHMPGLDGFEVVQAVPAAERPAVIFVTAHEQHAVRAFDICAQDYLLKPVSRERFAESVNRAKLALRSDPIGRSGRLAAVLECVRRIEAAGQVVPFVPKPAEGATSRLILKADGALHFIDPADVLWAEAQGDYVKVQTTGRSLLVRETLQLIERRLDSATFMRIHRSFVVNLSHVRRVQTALYGDYSVLMSDGSKLRLSRSYRAQLDEWMKPAAVC